MNRAGKTRLRRNRRGAALVEMAIVLVLLMLLVFGIIDFGLLFKDYLALSQVAREAARCGALGGNASARVGTWATNLGLNNSYLTPNISTTGSSPGGEITVTLYYEHHTIMGGFLGIRSIVPLKTTMVMRLE